MGVFNKILNYKNTIRYHKWMVTLEYWKQILKLSAIKFFKNKIINIIVLPEHIGDIIAFSPFAEKLKKENKKNHIVWLVKPIYSQIIEENKFIDNCISISCDGVAQLFSNNKIFEVYDVRFNGNNFCNICQTERKHQKIDNNFTLDNYYEYGSLLEIFSMLANKPMKKEEWQPNIFIPYKTEKYLDALNLPTKFICIHTTSNDENREWTYPKWNELIERVLSKHDIKIIQIGLENKLNIEHKNFMDFCGKLSLIETAGLIKRSGLFIGIDSGPAHMANAVKAKSIILLGKYRKITNYMPFSGNFANGINSKIIYNPEIKCSEIAVGEIYEEVMKLLL